MSAITNNGASSSASAKTPEIPRRESSPAIPAHFKRSLPANFKIKLPNGAYNYSAPKSPTPLPTPSPISPRSNSSPISPRSNSSPISSRTNSSLIRASSVSSKSSETETVEQKAKSVKQALQKLEQKKAQLLLFAQTGCSEIIVKYEIFKNICKQCELTEDIAEKRTLIFQAKQCIMSMEGWEGGKGPQIEGVFSQKALSKIQKISSNVLEKGIPLTTFKKELVDANSREEIKGVFSHEDAVDNVVILLSTELEELSSCTRSSLIFDKIKLIQSILSKIRQAPETFKVKISQDEKFSRFVLVFKAQYMCVELDEAFEREAEINEQITKAEKDEKQAAIFLFQILKNFKSLDGLKGKSSDAKINEIVSFICKDVRERIEQCLELTDDKEKLKRLLLAQEGIEKKEKSDVARRCKVVLSKEMVGALLFDDKACLWDSARMVICVSGDTALYKILQADEEFAPILNAFFNQYQRLFNEAYDVAMVSPENYQKAYIYALDMKKMLKAVPQEMQTMLSLKIDSMHHKPMKEPIKELSFTMDDYVWLLDKNLLFFKDTKFCKALCGGDETLVQKMWTEFLTPFLQHRDIVNNMNGAIKEILKNGDKEKQLENLADLFSPKLGDKNQEKLILKYTGNTQKIAAKTNEMGELLKENMSKIIDWFSSSDAQEFRAKAHSFIGIGGIASVLDFPILAMQRFMKFPLLLREIQKEVKDTNPLHGKLSETCKHFDLLARTLNEAQPKKQIN